MGAGCAEEGVGGHEVGDELGGWTPVSPAQVGLQALVGPDALASRAEGIPQGAGQSTEVAWPQEPSPPPDCSCS